MSDYRFVDLDEQRLVVLVDPSGQYEVRTGRVCVAAAADLLREIAAQLDASHPPFPCDPSAESGAPKGRPAEPVDARHGRLDRDLRVWTDGHGHRWDLSLTWIDVTDQRWRWHGSTDSQGAPLLRSEDGETVQPLDVVRMILGPIAPVIEAAE